MRLGRMLCVMMWLLSACAQVPVAESDWPAELPSYQRFYAAYRSDSDNAECQSFEHYLMWVKRFYLGWELYPNGWNSLSKDLLLGADGSWPVVELKAELQRLGLQIAAEWAKDNRIRRIDTRQVSIWGKALLNSRRYGETAAILERVAKDVEDRLQDRIAPEAITENRFYAEEDIFVDVN